MGQSGRFSDLIRRIARRDRAQKVLDLPFRKAPAWPRADCQTRRAPWLRFRNTLPKEMLSNGEPLYLCSRFRYSAIPTSRTGVGEAIPSPPS
jgi:hypothetical protein